MLIDSIESQTNLLLSSTDASNIVILHRLLGSHTLVHLKKPSSSRNQWIYFELERFLLSAKKYRADEDSPTDRISTSSQSTQLEFATSITLVRPLPPRTSTMSFLFGSRPQLSSAEKIAAAETEVEMVSDMFNRYLSPLPLSFSSYMYNYNNILVLMVMKRLSQSCTKKCIPPEYREADLNKGESVCLDRCVSKFFEVNLKVSEKMQGEAAGRGGAGAGGGVGGGGMGGFGV